MQQQQLQHFIDLAVGQLDYLDPILGYDLQFVCATRPIDGGMFTCFYEQVLERANVWPQGTMRQAWSNVLDCLAEISNSEHVRKAGV